MRRYTFNINGTVRVRLTQAGREEHKRQWSSLMGNNLARASVPPYSPPQEDRTGWSEWQLWDLMQAFGPSMALGAALMFETEIEMVK